MARRKQQSLFGQDEPEERRAPRRLTSHGQSPRRPMDVKAFVRPTTPPSPPMERVMDARTTKVAEHRGKSRIWLEGKWLARAGFSPGNSIAVLMDPASRRITIALNEAGSRIVSRHRDLPVIELSSHDVAQAVGSVDEVWVETIHGRIVVRPKETTIAVEERRRDRNALEGSVFSGAGFLTLAASQAGYTPAFGIEKDETCAEVFGANHPSAVVLGDIVETALIAARNKIALPHVDLLTAGIPCPPYSRLTRGKRIPSGECVDDPATVSMAIWFAQIVKATNPYNVVIEQVEDFLDTSMFVGLKGVLTLMGYHVQHAVLDANDFGLPTGRRRAVIVATTDPAAGLIERVARRSHLIQPTAGDILLPPYRLEGLPHSQGGWFTARSDVDFEGMTREILQDEARKVGDANYERWLPAEWGRGKFTPQFIDESTTRIRGLVKRYAAPDPSGPWVRHPRRPDTFRLLTVEEIKRLHGVPADYQLTGHYPTDVGLLGQGVVVDVFRSVIEELPGGSPRRRNAPGDYVFAALEAMSDESERIEAGR